MSTTYKDMNRLSEIQLLSLILKEPVEGEIVRGIIGKIIGMEDLLSISIQELEDIEGMEDAKAEQFLAGIELAKRIYASPTRVKEPLTSPEAVAQFLLPQMRYLEKENFVCLYLNRKNCLKFVETISIGGLYSSIVHPREVYKFAVKRSAATIILSHNHPSGCPEPSKEDIAITQRLVEAGEIMGIPIIDHIIIGDNVWTSLKQSGLM